MNSLVFNYLVLLRPCSGLPAKILFLSLYHISLLSPSPLLLLLLIIVIIIVITIVITTQGDPLAMCMYAVSPQPLIYSLQAVSQAKRCWFADDESDDAIGYGSLLDIRVWWYELIVAGPELGYYPNAGQC